MVGVFREVRRVLRNDGTLWLNVGDSYAHNGACGGGSPDGPRKPRETDRTKQEQMAYKVPPGLKPKDLVGIPWRLAFALQADGWYLRSDIIWHKPNPMPESVTDRPTKSHEYLFLLSKRERYFFDGEAVREEGDGTKWHASTWKRAKLGSATDNRSDEFPEGQEQSGRNIRSVWSIPTESYPGSHFATFPRKLVEPCIKAGTSEKGCCSVCGALWEREVKKTFKSLSSRRTNMTGQATMNGWEGTTRGHTYVETTGWHPPCSHDAPAAPCVILDPFSGTSTTGVVALALQRHYIGLDLSREYLGQAVQRLDHPHALVQRPTKEEYHPLFDPN